MLDSLYHVLKAGVVCSSKLTCAKIDQEIVSFKSSSLHCHMEWNGFETVRLVYMFSVKDLIDYLI